MLGKGLTLGFTCVPASNSEYGFEFAHRRQNCAVHGDILAALGIGAEDNKESLRDAGGVGRTRGPPCPPSSPRV